MNEESNIRRSRLRVIRITGIMAAIFVFFQFLPDLAPERPSTLLRQMTGDGREELCDVGNLGFLAVNEIRSPVRMRVKAHEAPVPGRDVPVTVAFSAPGGRPLGEEEIMENHTEKIHLLIVDSSLDDYHHVHPRPGSARGEYDFTFRPKRGGEYKVFADLMPRVTGRPVQAVAPVSVAGDPESVSRRVSTENRLGEYSFSLVTPEDGLRVHRPAVVTFQAREVNGGAVRLEPVMDAFAHLVVFDTGRTGFAHLHPVEDGLDVVFDETAPELRFIFHVDTPGYYRVWAQVKINGEEVFVPFGVEVQA